MLRGFLPTYYESDTGGGAGGGAGGDDQSDRGRRGADPAEAFQHALQRENGDANRLATRLYDENYRYRERIRALEGRAAPEGAVVLTGDDARAWQAYRELGPVADVQTALRERETAQQELARLQRADTVRRAAEIHGYKPSVLERLAGDLALELRDETVDGKLVTRALIRDGETVTPLTEYAARAWADFLPALTAEPIAPRQNTYVRQDAGGKAAPANAAQQYIQKTYRKQGAS